MANHLNILLLLILIFPLIGFVVSGLSGNKISKLFIGILASTMVFIPFVCSVIIATHVSENSISLKLFDWIQFEDFSVSLSFFADPLTALMLLIITGVGFLIHVYSIGYMWNDEGIRRFFSYMNLFIFFMLILVLSSNYLVMFIGWEGVGLCSYLLIGFWYSEHANNNAAKKAFIMNRIGDLGFLLALFLIFTTYNSLEFSTVFGGAARLTTSNNTLFWICVLLFMGATGKSAQIPLYTWLPDAMAGPTPVSALIHAATMVTAGIYMIARSSILFVLVPEVLGIIAIVGITTALLAATIAIFQNDIKKVLAYSTVSQLGYMFAALGVGGFSAAMFHLTTHAFFKALLFLAAGSVIHALSGEQDIHKMGGLSKKIKITSIVFLAGCIAISGIPPFSGFFSKDEILTSLFEKNPLLWILGVAGALMTAFYMFRLYFLVFKGNYKGDEKTNEQIHESPKVMTIPLIVLALFAIGGGWIGLPAWTGAQHLLNMYLSPVFSASSQILIKNSPLPLSEEMILILTSVIVVLISVICAWFIYLKKYKLYQNKMPVFFKIFEARYWVDEIYVFLFVKPILWMSDTFYKIIEIKWLDGIVNGIGIIVVRTGNRLRYIQNGFTEFYVFMIVLGIIALLLMNQIIR
ncbi:MAG: NADH-quinone oxidoreductase subunit L [Bacteroidales bacterium]